MPHTFERYRTVLQRRRREFQEYVQYSRQGGAYALAAGPGDPVFHIDEGLGWRSVAKLFHVGRLTNYLRRLNLAHLREIRRITAYNRWIQHHFEHLGEETIYNDGSVRLQMPRQFPNARMVAVNDLREIYLENRYSNLLPHGKLVDDGDVVVDCGANIGAFTVLAATQASGVRVLAFEPEPVTYDCLRENIRLNGLDNRVVCLRYGLSAKRAEYPLLRCDECFTMHRVGDASVPDGRPEIRDAVKTVTCVTLDEIVAEQSLTRCDLIKMDIEGAEQGALRGAVNTLRRFRPKLTIAAYHRASDPFLLSVIIKEICPDYNIFVSRDFHLYAFV